MKGKNNPGGCFGCLAHGADPTRATLVILCAILGTGEGFDDAVLAEDILEGLCPKHRQTVDLARSLNKAAINRAATSSDVNH